MRQRYFFSSLMASSLLIFSPYVHADTIDKENDSEVDVQALREWINTKRQVTVKEIGGNLSLSGEVRTEFQKTAETKDGVSQRGGSTAIPSSQYDVAVNILLDYRADLTWASIKLEFDNDAGASNTFGGTTNKIKVSRAYFGGRVLNGDDYYLDCELGRRKLSAIFDSKLEFSAYFDGGLVKYSKSFERVGDVYFTTGVFIIDERKSQYGYVGETGFMNIMGSGFYTKYSMIDWDTKNFDDKEAKYRFDFLVSQLIVGYKFYPVKLQKQVTLYLAGLYNFKAKKIPITNQQKENWGSYIGFSVGQLRQKGDWALDVNYQLLAAQAVPEFDVSGIGTGNADGATFYPQAKGGDVNYRGISITLDYLLTNNLTLQQQWQQSVNLNNHIGSSRTFKQYEIEFIYGF